MNKIKQENIHTKITEAILKGTEWEVTIIAAGASLKPTYYPEDVLKTAAPMFEKADINIYSQFNHLSNDQSKAIERMGVTLFANLVGYIKNARWDENSKSIKGNLHIFDAYKDVQSVLKESFNNGKPLGLSVDIRIRGYRRENAGREEIYITEMVSVESVDIVTNPAAGGAFDRIVANVHTIGEPNMNKDYEDFKAFIERHKLLEIADTVTDVTGLKESVLRSIAAGEDEKEIILLESISDGLTSGSYSTVMGALIDLKKLKVPAVVAEPEKAVETVTETGTIDKQAIDAVAADIADMQQRVAEQKLAMDKAEGEILINASNLPDIIKETLIKKGIIAKLDKKGYEEIVNEAKVMSDMLTDSGIVKLPEVQITREKRDIDEALCKAFFARESVKMENGESVEPFFSIHKLYKVMSGDHMAEPYQIGQKIMRGFSQNPSFASPGTAKHAVLESMRKSEGASSGNWAYILSNTMTNTLQTEYAVSPFLADVMRIVTKFPAKDFNDMYMTKMSQYGTVLASVVEAGTYSSMTSPTNVRASGTITKSGGFDTFTLEMMVNDDVDAFQQIPQKLGRIAAWSMYYKIMTMITGNGTYTPDGTRLIASGHNNEVASGTAFSAAALTSAELNMGNQTGYGGLDYLGGTNVPKILLVSPRYKQLALEIANSTTRIDTSFDNTTYNYWKNFNLEVIILNYLGITGTYWWAMSDPKTNPFIRLSFLGGNENPEIFLQDGETSDIMMGSDSIKFKIRQIYGAMFHEYRNIYGTITA